MVPIRAFIVTLFLTIMCVGVKADDEPASLFETKAPRNDLPHPLRIKTNIIPWIGTVANAGAEYVFHSKWSVNLDLWFCPWKISSSTSLKTVMILPEVRWWLKEADKGSFFNVHLTCGWYNLRKGANRYQDADTPLLGAGIGYGYKLPINEKFSFEFVIGAGYIHTKCDKFYNVANGALIHTKMIDYIGVDRLAVNFVYNIGDL